MVNLERSMKMNGRLDGHIVQGHVDCTARCVGREPVDGSVYFTLVYLQLRSHDGLDRQIHIAATAVHGHYLRGLFYYS